jgi:pimeloyl-ACP methyl ester carboxylesterase
VPTLVIAGERDAEQARANYDRWARGIPGAKKVVVPRAAHLVNIDQPQEFMRIVLEFLRSL